MTQEKLNELFHKFTKEQEEVLIKKNNDYASVDALSNFKTAGNIALIGPELNALSLIATKVSRLGVLLNSEKPPLNEAVEDSVMDLANYAFLLYAILKDVSYDRAGSLPTAEDLYDPAIKLRV